MKWWNSAFNAQDSRLIIVIVQLRAVNLYVVAMEALRKKETQDETKLTTKIDGFLSFIPPWMPSFFESHPVYDQIQGFGAVFFLLYG